MLSGREGAGEERQTQGAGEERQTLRGCRLGETDTCVLSGRLGETDTERVQVWRDRHLCVVRQRGCRLGETHTQRVQVWRDRH